MEFCTTILKDISHPLTDLDSVEISTIYGVPIDLFLCCCCYMECRSLKNPNAPSIRINRSPYGILHNDPKGYSTSTDGVRYLIFYFKDQRNSRAILDTAEHKYLYTININRQMQAKTKPIHIYRLEIHACRNKPLAFISKHCFNMKYCEYYQHRTQAHFACVTVTMAMRSTFFIFWTKGHKTVEI